MTLSNPLQMSRTPLTTRTSLAVQWLRLYVSNAGSMGSVPGQELGSCKLHGETIYLRLRLEPSQNPAWDLNPRVWDENPVKIHSTWFQDLMKLRFLISHHRKNSVRDKVIGKKWIYPDSERSTLHRQSVGHHTGQVQQPRNLEWLVFIGWVISYANEQEDYSNYFWEGAEISRIWATAHSLVFLQCLGPVILTSGCII